MEESKKLPINFVLADVQTEQFAIIESAYKDSESDTPLLVTFKFGYLEEDKSIVVMPYFSFEQNEVPFLILEIACVFRIEDESWKLLYNEDRKSVELSKGFAAHIAAISVGTARGVLHAKTEQTIFNRFTVPLMNVNEYFTDNIVLQEKKTSED